jgi:hypothetical protein
MRLEISVKLMAAFNLVSSDGAADTGCGNYCGGFTKTPKMDFVSLGFIDIFSESKEGLGIHSSMILRFLHRNRISSMVIPYPMLDHCNNMCTMRSSVLKESLDQLVQKEKGMCMGELPENTLLLFLLVFSKG